MRSSLLALFGLAAFAFSARAQDQEPPATPVAQLKVAKDFKVELLYSVPKDQQGSWVNMCVDPKGRLIVSDQYGGLYRVTVPPLGTAEGLVIEPIPVDIGEAQGLLWAFDSLYVVVNKGAKYESGLYRARDTDKNDMLDTVELLRPLDGGAEHGPHAVLLSPDGLSLYIVCGNKTKLTELVGSRVPALWDEDITLPRSYGRGFMRETPAPGGFIARVDPEGKSWELIAVGFRNEYDAAFNRHGDLFTYDSDMEWDFNTPWYRPTRVCLVPSGAEFGWRNGSGKHAAYYADSLPAVADIGPGSPTGVTFGYGAKFPGKYQEALFACDWSYGKLYAVHLESAGASYKSTVEEFITGTPLPLTDVIINPHDGAMYFTIGGRKTKSGLYRATYTGSESTTPPTDLPDPGAEGRATRRKLEAFHGKADPAAVETAWPYLGSPDRFLRFAARVAVESQPTGDWPEKALTETDPETALTALLARVRMFSRKDRSQLDTPVPTYPASPSVSDSATDAQVRLIEALNRFDWEKLDDRQRTDLVRLYSLTFLRLGPPTEAVRQQVTERLDAHYPGATLPLNAELCKLLIYLQAPTAAVKTVMLLDVAPTQEEQIEYAQALRHLRTGWATDTRRTYLQWFFKAVNYRGGANFTLFVEEIRKDAIATLNDEERKTLAELVEKTPQPADASVIFPPRPFVKEWKTADLTELLGTPLQGRDFDKGKTLFAAAKCFACHRFDNQGGAAGPDLTALAGRFSVRDIIDSITEPSKVISDQYAAVTVVTNDGKSVTGRIVNLNGDTFQVNTDMLDPNALVTIDRRKVEETLPATASIMPEGLLNTLNDEEVRDLMAYLLSRGDRKHEMFGKSQPEAASGAAK